MPAYISNCFFRFAEPFPLPNGTVRAAGNVNCAMALCFENPQAYDFSPAEFAALVNQTREAARVALKGLNIQPQ